MQSSLEWMMVNKIPRRSMKNINPKIASKIKSKSMKRFGSFTTLRTNWERTENWELFFIIRYYGNIVLYYSNYHTQNNSHSLLSVIITTVKNRKEKKKKKESSYIIIIRKNMREERRCDDVVVWFFNKTKNPTTSSSERYNTYFNIHSYKYKENYNETRQPCLLRTFYVHLIRFCSRSVLCIVWQFCWRRNERNVILRPFTAKVELGWCGILEE